MRYEDFKILMMNKPFFNVKDISGIGKLDNTLKLQISKWIKQKKIIPLKKGFYTLNDLDRKVKLSPYLLANELYFPSYVSLEFALSLYHLIPEAVNIFTSITTNKTKTFKNIFGTFVYHSIKKEYFFDFRAAKSPDNYNYFLATPEKAVIDFIYYNISFNVKDLKSELLYNYRFQNLDLLNIDTLKEYKKKFKEKKIIIAIKILEELIQEWS